MLKVACSYDSFPFCKFPFCKSDILSVQVIVSFSNPTLTFDQCHNNTSMVVVDVTKAGFGFYNEVCCMIPHKFKAATKGYCGTANIKQILLAFA